MELTVAVTARLAAVAITAYVLPLVGAHLASLWVGLAVGLALGVSGVLTATVWLRAGAVTTRPLLWDVPVGVVALWAGAAIADPQFPGWSWFAFAHTLMASFSLGLATRTPLQAVALVLPWAASLAGAGVWLLDVGPLLDVSGVLSYLAYAVLGHLCGRLQRRASARLAVARAEALRTAGELATLAERQRLGRALHDRILQTVEALARPGTLPDPAAARLAADRAAWLRRFVETGGTEPDLATGLDRLRSRLAGEGLEMTVNDAALRAGETTADGLGPAARQAALETLSLLADALAAEGASAAVLRVSVSGPAVRLGMLVTAGGDGGEVRDAAAVERARRTVDVAGGRLRLSPGPYIECELRGG